MNSFQVLKLLTPELKSNLLDLRFRGSSTPSRLMWVAEFDDSVRDVTLTFCALADAMALFTREGGGGLKRRNTRRFFESIVGEKVTDVWMADTDRILTLQFESGRRLRFTLFGPRANVLLLAQAAQGGGAATGDVLESFRKVDTEAGPPQGRPTTPRDRRGDDEPVRDPSRAMRCMLEQDPKLPRKLLRRLFDGPLRAESLTCGQWRERARQWEQAMLERPEFRVLSDGTCCLIPADLLPGDWLSTQERFRAGDANEMIRYAFTRTAAPDRLQVRIGNARDRIRSLIRKREHTLAQMAREDKTLDRAQRAEQFGHILLAHPHAAPAAGESVVRLPDLFGDGAEVAIPVDPDKTMAENASDYYGRSVKGKRRAASLEERRTGVEAELEILRQAEENLQGVRTAKELKQWETAIGAERLDERPAAPYRQVDLDGFRLWIGRNARSNDRVLADSHKEDLWMHARGVGGSHVVLRMEGSKQMPPASILERAAAAAAWHSQDRGASVVPVTVTRRKYVVKPKGGAPGAVKILNEQQVLHVSPESPSP